MITNMLSPFVVFYVISFYIYKENVFRLGKVLRLGFNSGNCSWGRVRASQENFTFPFLRVQLVQRVEYQTCKSLRAQVRLSPCIKEMLGQLTLFIRFTARSRISNNKTEKRKLSNKIFIFSGETNFGQSSITIPFYDPKAKNYFQNPDPTSFSLQCYFVTTQTNQTTRQSVRAPHNPFTTSLFPF